MDSAFYYIICIYIIYMLQINFQLIISVYIFAFYLDNISILASIYNIYLCDLNLECNLIH